MRPTCQPLVALARRYHCLPVAIVFDLPERLCLERNRGREDRDFGSYVIRQQRQQLRRSLRGLEREGFRHVFVLSSPEEVDAVGVERQPLWNNLKHEHGPFDIIGDVHGCLDELVTLLRQLGYEVVADGARGGLSAGHPEGRKAVFLGDLVELEKIGTLPVDREKPARVFPALWFKPSIGTSAAVHDTSIANSLEARLPRPGRPAGLETRRVLTRRLGHYTPRAGAWGDVRLRRVMTTSDGCRSYSLEEVLVRRHGPIISPAIKALESAVGELRSRLGDEVSRWQWGRLHEQHFQHPLGEVRGLDRIFNRGAVPMGGDANTIWQAAYVPYHGYDVNSFTASWRQIIDLADFNRSRATLPSGQSGHPGSRHYADMISPWRRGEYHPMLWDREQVEAQARGWLGLSAQ